MDDEEAPGAGPGLFSWADGTPLAVRAPIAAVSTYLNLMRLVAAALVFVSHASFRQVSDKLLWQIGDFGQQAVTVFFVLSGFVIAYVTHQRETDVGTYALHRAARIYSVAIPTLLLTLMLDSVNCHYGQSAWMTAQCTISGGFPILWVWRFWARSGALILVPGTNGPYWSLGFEVPYYLMFGHFCFGRSLWNWIGIGLLLILFGPTIALMSVVWLTGFACYRICIRIPCTHGRIGLLLWLASIAAMVAVAVMQSNQP